MTTLPGKANLFHVNFWYWLWLLTLAGRWGYWSPMLLSPRKEREQTISWLYFYTRYCSEVCLYFIGRLCGKGPIGSVTTPVSKYGGGKFLEYSITWYQLKALYKCLSRWGWGDYWCFLTSSLCCSHYPS